MIAQRAGEGVEHTVFNIPILQHIGDVMGCRLHHVQIFRISLDIGPKICLPAQIRGIERGPHWIPATGSEVIVVSLEGQKIREEHMPQFMGKHPGHNLIAVFTPAYLRHSGMPGVYEDAVVVRTGGGGVLCIPEQIDPDTPVVMIASCLRCGKILVVPGEDAGSEKLPVGDLAAFLVEKLLDALVIYPAQGSNLLLVSYAVARRTLGAKIGSRILLIRASRSASSAVALLMTVYRAD